MHCRCPVHHDLELVREVVVDVDLYETMGIAHHAEHRMMRVVVVGKRLPADEDQRLVARHEVTQVVQVDQVMQGVSETDDLLGMAGKAHLEALEDEVIAWTGANEDVAAPASDLGIVAARWLNGFAGPFADNDVEPISQRRLTGRMVLGINQFMIGGRDGSEHDAGTASTVIEDGEPKAAPGRFHVIEGDRGRPARDRKRVEGGVVGRTGAGHERQAGQIDGVARREPMNHRSEIATGKRRALDFEFGWAGEGDRAGAGRADRCEVERARLQDRATGIGIAAFQHQRARAGLGEAAVAGDGVGRGDSLRDAGRDIEARAGGPVEEHHRAVRLSNAGGAPAASTGLHAEAAGENRNRSG